MKIEAHLYRDRGHWRLALDAPQWAITEFAGEIRDLGLRIKVQSRLPELSEGRMDLTTEPTEAQQLRQDDKEWDLT